MGIPQPEENTNISYDYLRLAGNLSNVSKLLHTQLTASEGKTSLHNIQAFLSSLTRVGIKTKKYKKPADETEESPGPNWPTINTASTTHTAMCAHLTADSVYIHVKLLMNHAGKSHDPVLETIKALGHEYQEKKNIGLQALQRH